MLFQNNSILLLLKGKPWITDSILELVFTVNSRRENRKLREILHGPALPHNTFYILMTNDRRLLTEEENRMWS